MNNIIVLHAELGLRIKRERERLNLNQEEFGKIADVGKRTVIDWEKGKSFPNSLQLLKLKNNGMNLNEVFDLSPFKCKYRYSYQDIMYDEKKIRSLDEAMKYLNIFFEENENFNLLNLNLITSKENETIGLRFFFSFPSNQIRDESESLREFLHDDMLDMHRKHAYRNNK